MVRYHKNKNKKLFKTFQSQNLFCPRYFQIYYDEQTSLLETFLEKLFKLCVLCILIYFMHVTLRFHLLYETHTYGTDICKQLLNYFNQLIIFIVIETIYLSYCISILGYHIAISP